MRRSEPGSTRPVHSDARPWWTRTPDREVAGDQHVAAPPTRHIGGDQVATPPATPGVGAHPARPVPVTVWSHVDASLDDAFDHIVDMDPAAVFRSSWLLPAVRGAVRPGGAPQPQRWGEPGQRRIIRLTWGGALHETVLDAQRPGLLRLRLVPARGLLWLVLRGIDAQYVCCVGESGGTMIRWTAVLRPRHGSRWLVRAATPLWRHYSCRAIARLATAIDSAHGLPIASSRAPLAGTPPRPG